MANPKKEAADAIDELKAYLAKDRKAVQLVGKIERFFGELRRVNSQQKTDLETAESTIKTLRVKSDKDDKELALVQLELPKLQGRVHQMTNEVAAMHRKAEEFEERMNPTSSGDFKLDESEWWRTFKSLRKLLPKPPKPVHRIEPASHDDRAICVFDIGEISNRSDHELHRTIGLLAVLSESVGITSAFISRADIALRHAENDLQRGRLTQFAQWCGQSWLGIDENGKHVFANGRTSTYVPKLTAKFLDGSFVSSPKHERPRRPFKWNQKSIICGPRVEDDTPEDQPQPIEDYVQALCDRCGRATWMGKSQQQLMVDQQSQVLCVQCMVDAAHFGETPNFDLKSVNESMREPGAGLVELKLH